jgi:predicted phosphoadenosine phosphosulfate sulfurtransferase
VRAEESPARLKGLTSYETYKGETWGKVEDKRRQHVTMYPIYDWSYTDVWKAIHDNGWPYCKLYDYMYQYGVPVANMRVSNVHHETAVRQLFFLQEIEGETGNRITSRLSGINTAGQLREQFMTPKELPPMFSDWYEYRDHLLENLVPDPKTREYFRRTFASYDARYAEEIKPALVKTQIACILANDYHGTKLSVFAASHGRFSKNAGSKGGRFVDGLRT